MYYTQVELYIERKTRAEQEALYKEMRSSKKEALDEMLKELKTYQRYLLRAHHSLNHSHLEARGGAAVGLASPAALEGDARLQEQLGIARRWAGGLPRSDVESILFPNEPADHSQASVRKFKAAAATLTPFEGVPNKTGWDAALDGKWPTTGGKGSSFKGQVKASPLPKRRGSM